MVADSVAGWGRGAYSGCVSTALVIVACLIDCKPVGDSITLVSTSLFLWPAEKLRILAALYESFKWFCIKFMPIKSGDPMNGGGERKKRQASGVQAKK